MTWQNHLPTVRGKLLRDEPLGPFTWFRVGGKADVLFLPADPDDLSEFQEKDVCFSTNPEPGEGA